MELGQNKLDHSEFDTFREFYTGNWKKFVDYNIVDVELVDRLEDKLRLIDLCFTRAYDAKVNFSDIAYQVRTWDAIIYNYLKKKTLLFHKRNAIRRMRSMLVHMSRNLSLVSMTGCFV